MLDLIVSEENKIEDESLMSLIKDLIETVLRFENIYFDTEISLSFVNNEEIRTLNKDFRDVDSVTDVLSFPMYDVKELQELKVMESDYNIPLGDIVISLDMAREQAKDFGHSFTREICYLVCHSVLHLLGYDHMTEKDKKVMRKKEEEVLEFLGITREAM